MADRELSLREISDRLQIQDVLVRYTTAIDEDDLDQLDQVFTPDAHLDYTSSSGPRGRYPEVKAWLARALAPFPLRQHIIANTRVRLDGDRASARSLLFNPMGYETRESGLQLFYVGGHYDDELVWTPDGWRISQRIEVQQYLEGTLPEGHVIPD
jgi:3-phenylpropionate/cinnamic acid dioxygenase small subunit